MGERDDKGRFLPGNSLGKGRVPGSFKIQMRNMAWESINKIAKMIFTMPNKELEIFIKKNQDNLTRAEMAYLNASHDIKAIECILDRILGKTINIEGEMNIRNPLIEKLYEMSDAGRRREIDQLLEDRKTIEAECKEVNKEQKE